MRGILWLVATLTTAAPAAAAVDCAAAQRGHEALLASSFEVRRSFRFSINGDLKRREVARLTYRDGKVDAEILEEEVLSKGMVFEAEGMDFALAIKFDCARLEEMGDGRFELTSEDGLEVATFEADAEDESRGHSEPDAEPGTQRRAWRPIAWRLDVTERFLFKKFVVEGRAEYDELAWR